MAKITEDPPHEAEPLHYRSFLHAAQRARLAEARAAKPEPPEGCAASTASSPLRRRYPPTEDTALARVLESEVEATRASRWRKPTILNDGYGGSSSYSSRQSYLYLYRGHRYRLLEIRFSSTSAAE